MTTLLTLIVRGFLEGFAAGLLVWGIIALIRRGGRP